jgi:transposase
MRIEAGDVVLGVDTHKDVHVAAVLDALGRHLAVAEFGSTDAAAEQLLSWARRYGRVRAAGVEGTGSFGYRLTRRLRAAGVLVVEVSRPDRARRRRRGKSDPVDADAAARAVLAGDATAVPKDRGGPVGALRALMLARRSAVKARTQTVNQVHALLLGCDDDRRRPPRHHRQAPRPPPRQCLRRPITRRHRRHRRHRTCPDQPRTPLAHAASRSRHPRP